MVKTTNSLPLSDPDPSGSVGRYKGDMAATDAELGDHEMSF